MSRSIYRDMVREFNALMPTLPYYAILILFTYLGEHKEDGVVMSHPELMVRTGLSKQSVWRGKKLLIDKGVIEAYPQAGNVPDRVFIPALADRFEGTPASTPLSAFQERFPTGTPTPDRNQGDSQQERFKKSTKNLKSKNKDDFAGQGDSQQEPPIGKENARVILFERFANKKKGVSGSG